MRSFPEGKLLVEVCSTDALRSLVGEEPEQPVTGDVVRRMTVPAPALYWWHMKQDLSVADGVARARKIMAVVPAPPHKLPPGSRHEVTHDESWARLVTSTFQAFVVCRALGDDILTIIMVAGQDGREAENTRDVLRDVMKSGDIAGLLE